MTNKNLKYLIESAQDNLWGLTVNCVGQQHVGTDEPYPPQIHPSAYTFTQKTGRILDEYQLVYITRGRGTFQSESCKECEVKAGDMFLLFPGERHSYHPTPSVGWDEYWIGFKGENMDNRVKNAFFQRESPVFHVGMNEEIVNIYQRAITTANEQDMGYQQMLAGLVNLLLGLTYTLDKRTLNDHHGALAQINKAKVIMLENLSENLQPETIAFQVNMGYSRFRKVFKEFTGYAPFQYIQELRIQKSKELLAHTNMPLRDIAYEVGYDNPDYFATAFKRVVHTTPLTYRKQGSQKWS